MRLGMGRRVRAIQWLVGRSPWRRVLRHTLQVLPACLVLAYVVSRGDLTSPLLPAVALGVATVWLAVTYWRTATKAATGLAAAIGPIDTERLRLRPFQPDDLAGMVATIDAEVVDTMGWTEEYVLAMSDPVTAGLFGRPHDWMVTEQTGLIIGVVSAVPPKQAGGPPQLGWWTAPAARGGGRTTEAVAAALDALHAHGHPCVRIITAHDNLAIQRILDKVGAVRVADAPHTLPNGTVIDSRWYEHRA